MTELASLETNALVGGGGGGDMIAARRERALDS